MSLNYPCMEALKFALNTVQDTLLHNKLKQCTLYGQQLDKNLSVFLLEFICNPTPSNSRLVEHFQYLLPSIRRFPSCKIIQ